MVLLVPKVWQHAINKGRESERRRVKEILSEHSILDPETGQLIISEKGLRLIYN